MSEDVANWRSDGVAPPSDAESVAIVRASVLAAHSLQSPRWRASLSSRSTTSTAPRPTAVWADCRRDSHGAIPSPRTAIKNADFATKKGQGCKSSELSLTSELLPIDGWDVGAIDARQVELSNWIGGIGPSPVKMRGQWRQRSRRRLTREIEDLSDLPEVPQ